MERWRWGRTYLQFLRLRTLRNDSQQFLRVRYSSPGSAVARSVFGFLYCVGIEDVELPVALIGCSDETCDKGLRTS